MTRWSAALRGALAGLAWSALLLVSATALLRVTGKSCDLCALLAVLAPESLNIGSWEWIERWGFFAGVATVAGAMIGLLGRRLQARPWVRGLVLWAAFFVAVGLAFVLVLFVGNVTVTLLRHESLAALKDPLALPGLTFLTAIGILVMSPVLVFPLLAAAVTIEAWTRPGAWLEAPRRRAALLIAVLFATLAELAWLWFTAPVHGGARWLVP